MLSRNYWAPVQIRQSAITAANSVVWSMRNLGTKLAYLRMIDVVLGFDGVSAVSTAIYQFARFRTATPTAGTAIVPVRGDNRATANVAPSISDLRFADTGLTIAGVTFDAPFLAAQNARAVSGTAEYDASFPDPIQGGAAPIEPLIIQPNDGICIILGTASVVGDTIGGLIAWGEIDPR